VQIATRIAADPDNVTRIVRGVVLISIKIKTKIQKEKTK